MEICVAYDVSISEKTEIKLFDVSSLDEIKKAIRETTGISSAEFTKLLDDVVKRNSSTGAGNAIALL